MIPVTDDPFAGLAALVQAIGVDTRDADSCDGHGVELILQADCHGIQPVHQCRRIAGGIAEGAAAQQ